MAIDETPQEGIDSYDSGMSSNQEINNFLNSIRQDQKDVNRAIDMYGAQKTAQETNALQQQQMGLISSGRGVDPVGSDFAPQDLFTIGGGAIGGYFGGPQGLAIGASLGRKKVSSGAGGKKKPKNFFKAEPKVTSSESMEIKESVLDVVRKYAKKKKEKQPQKAQDAGARARRVMQRKEYASKVSGSTDNVPDNLRDSLQILKNLIQ